MKRRSLQRRSLVRAFCDVRCASDPARACPLLYELNSDRRFFFDAHRFEHDVRRDAHRLESTGRRGQVLCAMVSFSAEPSSLSYSTCTEPFARSAWLLMMTARSRFFSAPATISDAENRGAIDERPSGKLGRRRCPLRAALLAKPTVVTMVPDSRNSSAIFDGLIEEPTRVATQVEQQAMQRLPLDKLSEGIADVVVALWLNWLRRI